MGRIRRILGWDRLLFGVLLAAVAWLPWPLGSNRPWAWALAEATVFFAVGLALVASRTARSAFRGVLRDHWVVFALLAAWIAYQWLQTADLGPAWLAWLSPPAEAIYASTSLWTGDRAHSIAFDRVSVIDDALKNTLYIVLLATVLMAARSRKRLAMLAGVIVGAGVFQGLYGLAGYFNDPYGFPASGSFVNRNHFAGLIAIAFSLGLGLLYPAARVRERNIAGTGHRVRRAFELMMGWQAVVVTALLILAASLIFSQSRGGMGALLGGLAVVTAAGAMLRADAHAERRLLLVVALVAAAAAAWLGTGGLAQRWGGVGEEGRERLEVWRDTLRMVGDHPWFGVGADNYRWVITAYRGAALDRPATVTHAHNDYLELLAEQGLVGATLVGLPLLLVLARVLDGYRTRREPLLVGLLFGSLAAATGFLLHAAVDFTFQVPANAAWFFVVLGIGLSAARLRWRERISEQPGGGGIATNETSTARIPGRAPRTGRT